MTGQAGKRTRKAVLADLVKNEPGALRSRPAFLRAEWKRDSLLQQILRWHAKQRRAPSALIETELTALYRLLDKMDEMLERHEPANSTRKPGTKGKRRTGRPPKTPAKQSVPVAYLDEKTAPPMLGNSAMTNGEIRRTKKCRAYVRMVRLAEEIDEDFAIAIAVSTRNPTVIHKLQDPLRDVLKGLLPFEKPRLSAMKVSGDKKNPQFDLSGLADKELLAIRRRRGC